jgi:major membrane immunogen (membrane-anchored lipoprotein)
MKKIFLLLLAVVTVMFVTSCSQSEFIIDGKFTAYEVGVHSNAPQVTYVTVTITDGEIVGYDIDVRQGNVVVTEGETTEYSYSWKDMTKKELLDDYNMKSYGDQYELIDGVWVVNEDASPENEWYEQAELIEAYLLENGVDSVEVIDGRISNVAGVTIKDGGYLALAVEAVNLAKAGKFQAVLCAGDDLYIATMEQDAEGEMTSLMLDVLQGNPDGDTFAWSDLTKQEKGDDYGMKGLGGKLAFVDGEWIASDGKTTLEWYEQANLITDYILANGWNENLEALAGRGGTIDGTTLVTELAGATIHTQSYFDLLAELFDNVA